MQDDLLVCPRTRLPLTCRDDIPADAGTTQPFTSPPGAGFTTVGPTDELMVRSDGRAAYPVVDGIPLLLVPEMLTRAGDPAAAVDVTAEPYAEAYAEMAHYSASAASEARSVSSSPQARHLDQLVGLSDHSRARFPSPAELWLDAEYELTAQDEAFRHLGALDGQRVLQLGGRGTQAVKLLLAGAAEAWLVSPMPGELLFGRALAEHCGVAARFHVAAGLAEELPLADESFDSVYSQGCVHHWVVDRAIPECVRVLRAGGRFAAVEPWRGPLYGVGTKVLGKRDRKVHCVVLTAERIEALLRDALADARISHHGALTRYPLLAGWKAGVRPGRTLMWRTAVLDDRVAGRWPRLRDTGSSVALLGRRTPVPATAVSEQP